MINIMFLLEVHNTYHPFYCNMHSASYIDAKHNANINLIRFIIIIYFSNAHYVIFHIYCNIIYYYLLQFF